MSAISPIGNYSAQYTPATQAIRPKPALTQPPAKPAARNDPDHDGDTDKPGSLDVNG